MDKYISFKVIEGEPIRETGVFMNSNDYKERFIAECKQLQMKRFDLFIVEGVETFVNVEYIIEKVKESIGNYVEIRYLTLDNNSCVCRNFVPGSISLIACVNASEDSAFKTGYQKVQVANNGICVYSNNFDNKYHPSIEDIKDEEIIINRIINAFDWTVYTLKNLHFDIIGDEFEYIDNKLNKLNNNKNQLK